MKALLPMLMVLMPVMTLAAPDEAPLPVPPVAPAASLERPPADSPQDPVPGSGRPRQPASGWQDGSQRHDLPYGAGYEARQRGFGASWGGGRGFGRGRR